MSESPYHYQLYVANYPSIRSTASSSGAGNHDYLEAYASTIGDVFGILLYAWSIGSDSNFP